MVEVSPDFIDQPDIVISFVRPLVLKNTNGADLPPLDSDYDARVLKGQEEGSYRISRVGGGDPTEVTIEANVHLEINFKDGSVAVS